MVRGRGSDKIGIDLDLDFEIALAIVVYQNFVIRLRAPTVTSGYIVFMRVHYFGLVIYLGSVGTSSRFVPIQETDIHTYLKCMYNGQVTSRIQENYQYPD